MRRAKILFTSSLFTPFIQDDLALLRRSHDVEFLKTRGFTSAGGIVRLVPAFDVTYTWFASVYAFFVVLIGRLAGKRSIVVVGGVDAARMPEIGYGIWTSPWRRPFIRYAVRSAWKVLAVDASLREKLRELAKYDGANIEVLPTGYDPEFWTPGGEREKSVLTVAGGLDRPRFLAKGVDRFIECARRMPDVGFKIVGTGKEAAKWTALPVPQNLVFVPYLDRESLRGTYRLASVYVQPSRTEGLPNSLCEAMLCGCIPVGTRAGGIPTAIGEAGFIAQSDDAESLAAAIRTALHAPDPLRTRARARIAERFPLARREARLNEIIAGAIS